MFQTRSTRLVVLVSAALASFASCQRRAAQQAPVPSAFFIPDGARNVEHQERQGIHEVTYNVDAAYPASSFLCELTQHLDQRQWRGLREDALNPGSESSLVRGWGDYGNATRQPETHLHSWMAQWRNQDGDLLTYGLQYEYPASAKPELSKLKVFGVIWPAEIVRAQLGSRADELPALMMPAVFPAGPKAGDSANGRQCSPPQWSEFVSSKSTGAAPVPALPFELTQVRTIDIQSDIDGLAGRIAAILNARGPGLRVRTVHDQVSEPPDATLDFRAECRCNEEGAPNGFYVREAVLYKHGSQREWSEPARVLYHWTDAGTPAWKSEVSSSCFGQKTLSAACRTAFEQADVAFAAALASTLTELQNRR
jgi:hypothetical protein